MMPRCVCYDAYGRDYYSNVIPLMMHMQYRDTSSFHLKHGTVQDYSIAG